MSELAVTFISNAFIYSESSKDIVEWDQRCWRTGDWCEKEECKKMLGWGEEVDNGEFLYEENPELEIYR